MIKWWLAMVIGAVTMCIGYVVGILKAKGVYRMAKELVNRASELHDKTYRMLVEIENEQQN